MASVRCAGECVSRATDISGRSVHLTAQATWRLLALSGPRPLGRRVAPWRPGGRGSADAQGTVAIKDGECQGQGIEARLGAIARDMKTTGAAVPQARRRTGSPRCT